MDEFFIIPINLNLVRTFRTFATSLKLFDHSVSNIEDYTIVSGLGLSASLLLLFLWVGCMVWFGSSRAGFKVKLYLHKTESLVTPTNKMWPGNKAKFKYNGQHIRKYHQFMERILGTNFSKPKRKETGFSWGVRIIKSFEIKLVLNSYQIKHKFLKLPFCLTHFLAKWHWR